MENSNQLTAHTFRQLLESLIAQRKYVGINYRTDINELLSTTSIIKGITTKEGLEYIHLSNGEEIPLDKIVRVDGKNSPGYPDYDFSYNCSL